MVSILVGPAYFLVQYFIWGAVYGNPTAALASGTLHGLALQQMLTYYAANALIGYLTMDFADWNLGMLVRTGKFLTFALRPIHHRFFALSQKIGHRILGFAFEFVPCALIFAFLFHIPITPANPSWAIISIALSFLMTFYVNYTIGLSAFWLTNPDGARAVFQILQAMFSGAIEPLVFFPEILQKALFFLPFQYMLYVPSMVCGGEYRLGGIGTSHSANCRISGTRGFCNVFDQRERVPRGDAPFQRSRRMKRILLYMRAFLESLRVALSEASAYRANFALSAIIMLVSNLAFPFATVLIYGSGAGFPGWNFWEVLLMQGIYTVASGFAQYFFKVFSGQRIFSIREGTFEKISSETGASLSRS